MYSTIAQNAQVTEIRPRGHLNAANAAAFKTQLTETLGATNGMVVVDMEQVESLDSAGLMALVSGLSLAQRMNRKLILCSVSASIGIIFEITKLERVFEIYPHKPNWLGAIA
ncbi:MAG TPA: STAS domain-containing protein [Oscillatoriaceae cyanobacterium M33_DOE_052]|uniref:Anti-sigma factor antagonist n=1 Tax=Planktothricoides sp. SpSt-374 TaxID=2282167 RepID=A0A7C3ZJJ7_9CYAN|nr:STAS domain-containing protein [Oscillatoriaceae cyanobacterium M33_DOE_052]